MSQLPSGQIPGDGRGSNDPNAALSMEQRRGRGRASVTLRQEAKMAGPSGDLMDPANKSLADALRIAYRLLMLGIVVMVGVYAMSGFQTIQEAERGVRTTFGRISGENLTPGLRMSWPAPIGEILRVKTSQETMPLVTDFFPAISDAERKQLEEKGIQGLANTGGDRLDPDTDGMLLTADGYLVHAMWQVSYRRSSDAQLLRTIAVVDDATGEPSFESRIVISAVRRGVVHAAATMSVGEFLYDQADPNRKGEFLTVAKRAKLVAQDMLNALNAGIEIQDLNALNRMPPRRLIAEFNKVVSAESDKRKKIDDANSDARQRMQGTAGEAASTLLKLIDQYESQIALGKQSEAAQTLQLLHDAMQRKPITLSDRTFTPNVAGSVSRLLSEAQQYRTSVVTRAQGEATAYVAKLAAFKSNPQVFLTNEWTDALGTFMGRDSVQTLTLPIATGLIVLQINRDPDIARRIEQARGQREVNEAQRLREEERRREIHNRRMDGQDAS